MRYRPFGSTGIFVSELGLGTMAFGGKRYWKVIGELGGAAEVRLSAEHVARLDAASALAPEYPQWMIEFQERDRLTNRHEE